MSLSATIEYRFINSLMYNEILEYFNTFRFFLLLLLLPDID